MDFSKTIAVNNLFQLLSFCHSLLITIVRFRVVRVTIVRVPRELRVKFTTNPLRRVKCHFTLECGSIKFANLQIW